MEEQLEKFDAEFRKRYSTSPRLFQAPGRVNLIGEHTDYNEGFVMPFAIDRRTVVAGAARADSTIEVYACDMGEKATIDLSGPPTIQRGTWLDYVEGTARCLSASSGKLRGANLMITSTVPIGAGLSSSAAIEVSVGFALLSLSRLDVGKKQLAFASQKAEHEFVGTRSGIMDQFTSVFARAGDAMLLDCRSLDIDYIPIAVGKTVLAVIDTKVKHNLATSEYNTRREECESGVAILCEELPGINSLRDVTMDDLDEHSHLLPDKIRRRCMHVVSENARTLLAADAFRGHDFTLAGKLMSESHRSLRDDYEVSCPELDFLVETAHGIDGVYGARMTGGGFGGSTVNLVAADAVDEFKNASVKDYSSRFGFEPDFYLFRAAGGASEITLAEPRSPTDVLESSM